MDTLFWAAMSAALIFSVYRTEMKRDGYGLGREGWDG